MEDKENISKKNSKKSKKDDNFLMYIPRKKHLTFEVNKRGIVKLIFHHDKMVERVVRWLVKKSRISDVELDKYGSSVWLLIDGDNTVYDIGQELLLEFGDKIEPVYERLVMFLRYLNRKGWIAFDISSEKEEKLS